MEKNNIKIVPLDTNYYSEFADIAAHYFRAELHIFLTKEDIIKHVINGVIFKQLEDQIISIDIAITDGTIKGFIIYQVDSEKSDWNERNGHGFIREFFVDENYRKQGIGSALLASAESKLKTAGIKNIYLTSSSEYYVEDFYIHKGYKNENKVSPKNDNEYFSKEL